jgi:hypothetical protein
MAPSADVLQLGPPGKSVLRIERIDSEALPGLAELKSNFGGELKGTRTRTLEEREDEEGVLWRALIEPRQPKEGQRPAAVMLGARRIAGRVVLCSTLPGSTEAEVEAAARACDGLGR